MKENDIEMIAWQPKRAADGRQRLFEVFDARGALVDSFADVDEAIEHARSIRGLVQLVVIETIACFNGT